MHHSPARAFPLLKPRATSAPIPRHGGNLAHNPSVGVPLPGLSYPPSRPFYWASCSVQLSRDARSVRECGCAHSGTANRADCEKTRDRRHALWSVSEPVSPSLSILIQSAHQFSTDDAYRNKAGVVLRPSRSCGEAGAAGFTPSLPRPSPSFQVDDLAHVDGSESSLRDTDEFRRGSFHGFGKTVHERHC